MASLRMAVGAAFVAGLGLAVALTMAQAPFANGQFDYGVDRLYRGRLVRDPFPILVTPEAAWPLVGAGKWSADRQLGGAEGEVELRATAIYRGVDRMLEVQSVRVAGSKGAANTGATQGQPVTLHGEVVDSKCYLGVMKPGAGVTHRACAARCLHGGVPPALATGDGRLVWLKSERNLSEFAGVHVVVEGDVLRAHDLDYVRVRRIARE